MRQNSKRTIRSHARRSTRNTDCFCLSHVLHWCRFFVGWSSLPVYRALRRSGVTTLVCMLRIPRRVLGMQRRVWLWMVCDQSRLLLQRGSVCGGPQPLSVRSNHALMRSGSPFNSPHLFQYRKAANRPKRRSSSCPYHLQCHNKRRDRGQAACRTLLWTPQKAPEGNPFQTPPQRMDHNNFSSLSRRWEDISGCEDPRISRNCAPRALLPFPPTEH